jgi:hypothetical protein
MGQRSNAEWERVEREGRGSGRRRSPFDARLSPRLSARDLCARYKASRSLGGILIPLTYPRLHHSILSGLASAHLRPRRRPPGPVRGRARWSRAQHDAARNSDALEPLQDSQLRTRSVVASCISDPL